MVVGIAKSMGMRTKAVVTGVIDDALLQIEDCSVTSHFVRQAGGLLDDVLYVLLAAKLRERVAHSVTAC